MKIRLTFFELLVCGLPTETLPLWGNHCSSSRARCSSFYGITHNYVLKRRRMNVNISSGINKEEFTRDRITCYHMTVSVTSNPFPNDWLKNDDFLLNLHEARHANPLANDGLHQNNLLPGLRETLIFQKCSKSRLNHSGGWYMALVTK